MQLINDQFDNVQEQRENLEISTKLFHSVSDSSYVCHSALASMS